MAKGCNWKILNVYNCYSLDEVLISKYTFWINGKSEFNDIK